MPLFYVFPRFVCVQVIQPFFFRLSEVDCGLFHRSENDEEIRVQLLCQELAGEILVNNSAGSF